MSTRTAAKGPRVKGSPRDFHLAVPPGWVRLPIDDALPVRVKTFVADHTAHAPAKDRDRIRTWMTKQLMADLQRAAGVGAIDLILSIRPLRGMPVPASCLISYLSSGSDAQAELRSILSEPGAGVTVRELDVVSVAGVDAVRRMTTREISGPVDLSDGAAGAATATTTSLDVAVPIPGDVAGFLLFAFTTPIEEIAPAMTQLWDAMLSTLRWVW